MSNNFRTTFEKTDFFNPERSPYYIAVILVRAVYADLHIKPKIYSNVFSMSILKQKDFSDEDILHITPDHSEVISDVLGMLMRNYLGFLENPGQIVLFNYINDSIKKHKTI